MSSRLPARPELVSAMHRNINLTRELAVTAFKLKYTGSALGYVWSLIKPLLIFGMMYVVFAVILLRGQSDALKQQNFVVGLLLGVVIWTFFADSTTSSVSAIAGNGHIIRKAYFPRWILVVASTLSATMTLAVNLGLIIAMGLFLGWFQLGLHSLVLPLLFVELYMLVLGIGLFFSALFTFYRDLGHIWEVLLQLLFYGSAIVYPLSVIPAKLQKLVFLNPTAQIIEDMRRSLVTTHIPWSPQVLGALEVIPLVLVVAAFGIGALVFRHLAPRFGEAL